MMVNPPLGPSDYSLLSFDYYYFIDKHSNERAIGDCVLAKFANMMLIVMVIVIIEILYIILIFDCFENQ